MKFSLASTFVLGGFIGTLGLSAPANAQDVFGDSFQFSTSRSPAQVTAKKSSKGGSRKRVVKRKAVARKKTSNQPSKVVKGQFEYVVCTEDSDLLVRNSSLEGVLFSVKKHEPVKLFQGWGTNRRTRVVGGKEHTYVKAQFPEHEDNNHNGIGWVSEGLIKLKSECASYKEPAEIKDVAKDDSETQSTPKVLGEISSLSDPDCCNFPLVARPTASYESGMRQFGWRRGGGRRLHAACDLYRRLNEPIESVAPGKVIRNPYYFYQGTYALEVRHAGGFVVRYGEVTGRRAKGVSAGAPVKTGQVIAYMGKVNSNCCEPMLHFELYSGKRSGSLTVSGNRYQRRSDLMNPTKHLRAWEKGKFGY